MNKTVTVNIGGIVFHIDENAYDRFKKYLESIRSHFTQSEGRDEIMQDIESRIAEMFQEKIKDSKQVITLEDVEQVTTQMGKPEQFGDEDAQQTNAENISSGETRKRRLFRNPDDNFIGGVCSGIASYFDIEAVWVRLVFVFIFFAFGSGIVLYILLWIIMPKANTTAEKLQMKGERVNVTNIEKNIKEEREQSRTAESDKSLGKKTGSVVSRIFEAIAEIFKFLFIFLGKLIAVFFLFIGLVIVFALVMSAFAIIGVPGTDFPNIWRLIFDTASQFSIAYIGVILVIGIPFLMLAYAGARILFNIKKGSKVVGMTALGLWLIGLALCLVVGVKVARQFKETGNIRNTITLMQPAKKKIFFEMEHSRNEEKDYADDEHDLDWRNDFDLIIKDDFYLSKNITVDVVKSQTDSFQLVEIFYARGNSKKSAQEKASQIIYTYVQKDSLVSLNQYFTIDKIEKYRAQKVQILLKVPIGGEVYLDPSLRNFIYDIDNIQNVWDADMLGRTWKMTTRGLTCVDCDGSESSVDGNKIRIHGDDASSISIDENGVRISGPDGERVAIDSNGIIIRDNKRVRVRIDGSENSAEPDEPQPPATPLIP
ncbi:MAG: PspC domain-containing protein [Bacteroidia bacterium]|nr:PspC domain-containing protein [Bacteroidia bacterium]